MNLLVLGPQGSGKGTQAKRIVARHGIPHVSTGDMFRAAISEGTPLGLRVKAILDSGELVPDDLTVALVRERLGEDDAEGGFVLDGFPRTLAQAEALDEMLGRIDRHLDLVLFFDVVDDVSMERLRGRAEEEGRDDDTPDVMRRRLEIYHQQTTPVIERYRELGLLADIPADRSIDEVAAVVADAVDRLAVR